MFWGNSLHTLSHCFHWSGSPYVLFSVGLKCLFASSSEYKKICKGEKLSNVCGLSEIPRFPYKKIEH